MHPTPPMCMCKYMHNPANNESRNTAAIVLSTQAAKQPQQAKQASRQGAAPTHLVIQRHGSQIHNVFGCNMPWLASHRTSGHALPPVLALTVLWRRVPLLTRHELLPHELLWHRLARHRGGGTEHNRTQQNARTPQHPSQQQQHTGLGQ